MCKKTNDLPYYPAMLLKLNEISADSAPENAAFPSPSWIPETAGRYSGSAKGSFLTPWFVPNQDTTIEMLG